MFGIGIGTGIGIGCAQNYRLVSVSVNPGIGRSLEVRGVKISEKVLETSFEVGITDGLHSLVLQLETKNILP